MQSEPFASLGNNLVGETDGSSGWVGSDLTGTSAQPLDPLLAPLGNYGGLTQTMALLPGSPAIDAGNNALIPAGVTTDQRGLARIVNGVVDIGAFESSLFTIAVTSGSGQSTGISTAFPAPLVATVTANNPIEPVAGGRVTFTPPQSGASATLTGNPATIGADGTASVGATANGVVGSYTVSAGARGITNTANFSLINQAIPTITTTPRRRRWSRWATSPVTLTDTAVAVARLLRDRLDHVHPLPGQHAGGHRDRCRSTATAATRRRRATRCRRRARSPGRTSGMPATAATPTIHGQREQRRGRAGRW